MTQHNNTQLRLIRRPAGEIKDSDFEVRHTHVELDQSSLQQDEVVVEHLYCGLDPGLRGWMDEMYDSYIPPVELGEVMPCTCISRVRVSRNNSWNVGDLVWGLGSWQHFQVLDGVHLGMVMKLPESPRIPLTTYLSVCGFTGLTAYSGMLAVGKPQDGEIVLISGAAGAVGSIAGQLAKIKADCQLIGIAGSADKCAWLRELGFDEALNYKQVSDMQSAIKTACPDGIDLFFDNVGGDILDAALMNLNFEARVLMCGTISNYNNDVDDRAGPENMWQLLVKNARIEGFTVAHHVPHWQAYRDDLEQWVVDEKLQYRDQIIVGLDNTLDGFRSLFTGANSGRVIMQFSQNI